MLIYQLQSVKMYAIQDPKRDQQGSFHMVLMEGKQSIWLVKGEYLVSDR